MRIDMKRDYWREYYQHKKDLDTGKTRDWNRLKDLRLLAEAKTEATRENWAALGIRA